MIWRVLGALIFASLFGGLGITVLVRLPPPLALAWALGLGAIFVWWHARRGRPRRRARVRLRRPTGSPTLMVLAGAATLLVAFGVAGLIQRLAPPLHDLDLGPWEWMMDYMRTPGGWIALTTFAALVVPVVEEFCFRGHIQHTIERRLAPWVAILITTALFTVVHISPAPAALLLLPAVLGLGMSMATILFRSIWVAVAVHGVWNAAMSVSSAVSGELSPEATGEAWLVPLSVLLLATGLAGWAVVLRDGRYRPLLTRARVAGGRRLESAP